MIFGEIIVYTLYMKVTFMEKISRSNEIENIRQASDIADIIGEYIDLEGAGNNLKGLCPFHDEKTPSFNVSRDKQLYHCFGCGEGGDVFHFIMNIEKIDFVEAVKILAERAGITYEPGYVGGRSKQAEIERDIYEVLERSAEYFHYMLTKHPLGKKVRKYLYERGYDDKAINNWKLGYATPEWDRLFRTFSKKGIAQELLEKAGLIIKRRDETGFYDRFRDRLMFAIYDYRGRVIGFGGRKMDDSDVPKYINSPETPVFRKRECLYGVNLAKEAIRKKDRAVIVEGYTDVITSYEAGIREVVAPLGTALTKKQVNLITRYTKNITINYDSDTAGETAALKSLDLIRDAGARVRVAIMPEGYDPDGVIKDMGIEEFSDILDSAIPIEEYKIRQITEKLDLSDIDAKADAVEKIVKIIGSIDNLVKQEEYVKHVSKVINIREAVIYGELDKWKRSRQRKGDRKLLSRNNNIRSANYSYYATNQKNIPAYRKAEMILIRLMIEQTDLVNMFPEKLGPGDFISPDFQKIVDVIVRSEAISPTELMEKMDKEKESTIRELLFTDTDILYTEKMFNDCILCLKRAKADREIKEIEKLIKKKEEDGDEQGLKAALLELDVVMRKLKKQVSFLGTS